MNPTAIAAVNSGVAALRSAVNPAGSVTVAMAIKVNGTAENRAPTTRKVVTRPRATRQRRGPATTSRTPAPIASRISAAQAGPTSRRGDAQEEERRSPDGAEEQE